MRQDLEYSPTDIENGRDFYLSKTTKGGYANYASSSWAMKERPLSTEERDAIDRFGLYNLSQFLPKKPDEAGVQAIIEMFHASVNEELYDMDRWGQYFRPNGMRMDNDSSATSHAPAAPAAPVTASSIMNKIAKPAVEETHSEPAAPAQNEAKRMQSPEDILAAIRARQKK